MDRLKIPTVRLPTLADNLPAQSRHRCPSLTMKMALALGSPSTMSSTMALASGAPWRRVPPPLAAGSQGGESLSYAKNYKDQYEHAYEDTHEIDGNDDYEQTCINNYKNEFETRTRTTTKTNVSMMSRTTTSPPTIASWSATGLVFTRLCEYHHEHEHEHECDVDHEEDGGNTHENDCDGYSAHDNKDSWEQDNEDDNGNDQETKRRKTLSWKRTSLPARNSDPNLCAST